MDGDQEGKIICVIKTMEDKRPVKLGHYHFDSSEKFSGKDGEESRLIC